MPAVMLEPLDPFALEFDSIVVDAAKAKRALAFDDAYGLGAPTEAPAGSTNLLEEAIARVSTANAALQPAGAGFYLLDDADGRFAIDRETGVITLADDSLLALERGAVHGVRVRVLEASGDSYELNFQLRITGRVPQMAGSEHDALAAMAAPEPSEAEPAPLLAPAPPVETIAWTQFAAFRASYARFEPLGPEWAAFGALLAPAPFSGDLAPAVLGVGELPEPSSRRAGWTL